MDRIRNEIIRWPTKVGGNIKKVEERRLKWYGRILIINVLVKDRR